MLSKNEIFIVKKKVKTNKDNPILGNFICSEVTLYSCLILLISFLIKQIHQKFLFVRI